MVRWLEAGRSDLVVERIDDWKQRRWSNGKRNENWIVEKLNVERLDGCKNGRKV